MKESECCMIYTSFCQICVSKSIKECSNTTKNEREKVVVYCNLWYESSQYTFLYARSYYNHFETRIIKSVNKTVTPTNIQEVQLRLSLRFEQIASITYPSHPSTPCADPETCFVINVFPRGSYRPPSEAF